VAHDLLRTLLEQLEVFREALTRPGFDRMLVIFVGWVQTMGLHAVTQALVATDVARRQHHEAFHRFFSRGTWCPDELGRLLLAAALRLVPKDAAISIVVDDTLAPKKGPHVFGIGSHIDAVRSTRRQRVFCFGHCWVVLAVRVSVPFARRSWALPLMFRLYRNKKECAAHGHPYRKKTELARQMIDIFLQWAGDRRVELAADSAYCNDTVTRGLPARLVLIGAMRPDAVLTTLPEAGPCRKTGRRRKRGELLPKPEALARDGRRPWQKCEAELYGKRQVVHFKEICGQWYRACGTRLLRVVVVFSPSGTIDLRVFFSTDATMTAHQILEGYGGRWSIEVAFKNLKQFFGFADSSARKREAVERTAPFVALSYSLLIIWFAEHAWTSQLAAPPIRPWYTHKRGFSFADILRAAQRTLASLDVLDPRRSLDNLHQLRLRHAPPSRSAPRAPVRRAA
jgi:hypothetical protein